MENNSNFTKNFQDPIIKPLLEYHEQLTQSNKLTMSFDEAIKNGAVPAPPEGLPPEIRDKVLSNTQVTTVGQVANRIIDFAATRLNELIFDKTADSAKITPEK